MRRVLIVLLLLSACSAWAKPTDNVDEQSNLPAGCSGLYSMTGTYRAHIKRTVRAWNADHEDQGPEQIDDLDSMVYFSRSGCAYSAFGIELTPQATQLVTYWHAVQTFDTQFLYVADSHITGQCWEDACHLVQDVDIWWGHRKYGGGWRTTYDVMLTKLDAPAFPSPRTAERAYDYSQVGPEQYDAFEPFRFHAILEDIP